MTNRAWILVIFAYAILAIGTIISLVLIGWQIDKTDGQADDLMRANVLLVGAAGAYCEVGLLPDSQENEGLEQVADLSPEEFRSFVKDDVCIRIVRRLEDAGREE